MLSNKKAFIYIVIFFIALSLRLFSAFTYKMPLEGDENSYNKLAQLLVVEGKYCDERETYSRTPAYSFFVSIIYFFFGCKTTAIRVVQAILDSLMCILIYNFCCQLFNRATAVMASSA